MLKIALVGTTAWLLATVAPAHAATACSADALNGLSVANVQVAEAKPVAATAQQTAFCQVSGTIATHGQGAPDGSARFVMQLPDAWKQRFVFFGVGGNAGNLVPSANGVDRAAALGKGYATILTDTGHVGDGTTARWARRPDGSIDQAKLIDFLHRATHDATVAGKALAQAFYAAPILHAYFDGCSTGGRMALVEGERYPDDYAGIVAGDPMTDFQLGLGRAAIQQAVLKTPAAWMSPQLLAAVDARITAACDAIDGAKDGLVQDPSRCTLKPADLRCKPGETVACLNADQVAVLRRYTSPLHDRQGRIVYPGWPLAHIITGQQGMPAYSTGRTAPDLSRMLAPWGDDAQAPRAWVLARELLAWYLGEGADADPTKAGIDPDTGVVSDALLARLAVLEPGSGGDPAKLLPFLDKGGKLLLYHGASDPSIPPARTVLFYRALAVLRRGKVEDGARLFLVPGMHHCGGGAGPDRFDTLSALETWVEQGRAPAAIPATTAPDAAIPHRLPLCPWPAQARYAGSGELADERNWRCAAVPSER